MADTTQLLIVDDEPLYQELLANRFKRLGHQVIEATEGHRPGDGSDKETPLLETFKGVIPFLAVDIVRVGLLIAFPAISLVLVRWLF